MSRAFRDVVLEAKSGDAYGISNRSILDISVNVKIPLARKIQFVKLARIKTNTDRLKGLIGDGKNILSVHESSIAKKVTRFLFVDGRVGQLRNGFHKSSSDVHFLDMCNIPTSIRNYWREEQYSRYDIRIPFIFQFERPHIDYEPSPLRSNDVVRLLERGLCPVSSRYRCVLSSTGIAGGSFGKFLKLSGMMRQLIQRPLRIKDAKNSDAKQENTDHESSLIPSILFGGVNDPYICLNVLLLFGLEGWAVIVLLDNKRNWRGWLIAFGSLLCLIRLGVSLRREDSEKERETRQHLFHNSQIVQQKVLTISTFRYTVSVRGLDMANVLHKDKQIAVIAALAEGSSIRSIERMTGINRNTIMKLGVKVGQGCTAMMDEQMRNLPCDRLELDEIWGFIGKKENSKHRGDGPEVGSVWTYCAIDADTKLVPAFMVGDRSRATTKAFVADVASRMKNRVQVSTDGFVAYPDALESAFGGDVDYGQIVKVYGTNAFGERKYSASGVLSSYKNVMTGTPDVDLISTSYVERLNATTRLHMRRLTRLTLAFSKKRENFVAAVGLHFAYYNFVKRHNTLKCTPAVAAGVTGSKWSVGDLIEVSV
jgi:IS1 family transposase